MLNRFQNIISQNKDKATSHAVKHAFNYKLKEIGEMLNFKMDSKNKTIEFEVLLEGEKEPLSINVQNYEITQEGEKFFLIAKDITTSRKWINVIASQYLSGKQFEIPSEYISILKLVM